MTGITTLVGSLFIAIAWLDSRHASGADLDRMERLLLASRVSTIEYQIEDAERKMLRIERTPPPVRTPDQNAELEDLKFKKEYLLRELERLEDD